jgi:very-short-patch-repair endonuclease
MFFDYKNTNIKNARALRKDMTKEERHLWHDFLKSYPIKFYKQRRIDKYIVDFYCSSAKLVIEIDGGQHYEPEAIEYDVERTNLLHSYGLHVMRFTNIEINSKFKEVCRYIDTYVKYGHIPEWEP